MNGIFPIPDGSHVNGVDRSKSKKIIASGDDWGLVNIYRNPVGQGAKVYNNVVNYSAKPTKVTVLTSAELNSTKMTASFSQSVDMIEP